MDEHTEPESPADGDPGRTGPTAASDTATGATNVAGSERAEQPGAAQQFAGPGTGPGWQQYPAPGAYPPPAGSSWYPGHTPGAPADGSIPAGYAAPAPAGYAAPAPAGYAAPAPAGYAAPGAQADGTSPDRPTWGAPPAASPATASQTRTRWKPWKKVAAGATLAAVVAVGGVAAVTAANASNESGSTQPGQGGNGAGGFGPGAAGYGGSGTGMPGGAGFGGRGSAMALAEALHGEFVVETDSGGRQTERLQRGQVTAVSAGSLSVSSTDGFAATYVIGSDLDVSGVAVGDAVRVVATVDGSTVTAVSVQSGTAGGPGGTGQGSGTGGGAGEQTPPGNGQTAPQTS